MAELGAGLCAVCLALAHTAERLADSVLQPRIGAGALLDLLRRQGGCDTRW